MLFPTGTGTPTLLDSLDIAGAKSVFIAGGSSSSGAYRVASTSGFQRPKLYKMNEDHSIQPVTSVDPAGKPIEKAVGPVGIWEINDDYFCLTLGSYGDDTESLAGFYLVRKADGKAAKITKEPWGASHSYKKPVQGDAHGMLYAVVLGTLYKLDPKSMSDKLVITTISSPTKEVLDSDFAVSPNGDAYTQGAIASDEPVPAGTIPRMTSFRFIKRFKPDGTAQIIKSSNTSLYFSRMWAGLNGTIFLAQENSQTPLQKIQIDPDDAARIVEIPDTMGFYSINYSPDGRPPSKLEVRAGDKVIRPSGSGFKVFSESEEKVSDVSLGLNTITRLQTYNKVFYALGKNESSQDTVVRYDPASGDQKVIYTADASMSIYDFAVLGDSEFILNAIRLTDASYVVVRVDESGALTELSADLPKMQQIVVFQ